MKVISSIISVIILIAAFSIVLMCGIIKTAKNNMNRVLNNLQNNKVVLATFIQKQFYSAFKEVSEDYIETKLTDHKQIGIYSINYYTKIDNKFIKIEDVPYKYFLSNIDIFPIVEIILPEEYLKIKNRSKLRASLKRIFNMRFKLSNQQCEQIQYEMYVDSLYKDFYDFEEETAKKCEILNIPIYNNSPQLIDVFAILFLPNGYIKIGVFFANQPLANEFTTNLIRNELKKRYFDYEF